MTVPDSSALADLLRLDHVDASYGPFRALFDVSFSVPYGAAVALLGTNGTGKTTAARVASGLLHPTRGTVSFHHHDITGLPTHEVARRGIAHCVEGRSVFGSLTVAENLTMMLRLPAGTDPDATRFGTGGPLGVEAAYELFPRLGERRSQIAGTLSGGEQRMLALAPVLIAKPRLVIADELSLGLAPVIVDEVYQRLAEAKAAGTALLIVEQHADHALALADKVVVLRNGSVAYDGVPLPLADLAPHILGT